MSWRIVAVTGLAKLDYKMDYLVVRTREETKRIHLSEISVLLIESTAVSLTAYLLCELGKRRIDVIFCDERRLPMGTFLPLAGSHDSSLKFRRQIAWLRDARDFTWAEVVRSKILGQLAVLEYLEKPGAELLASYLPEIEPADATNREGHAAKVYFNSLFGMEFSRSQENNINAALNYGYSILLSLLAREIAANGYANQLGIFHDNVFNKFNLACDLMEPFRPFVDLSVFRMEHERFEHDEKMYLVQIFNRQIQQDGKMQYMLNAVRQYTKSILDAVDQNDLSVIKWPSYELSLYEDDRFL